MVFKNFLALFLINSCQFDMIRIHFKTKIDSSYSEKLGGSLSLVRAILGLHYTSVKEREREREREKRRSCDQVGVTHTV